MAVLKAMAASSTIHHRRYRADQHREVDAKGQQQEGIPEQGAEVLTARAVLQGGADRGERHEVGMDVLGEPAERPRRINREREESKGEYTRQVGHRDQHYRFTSERQRESNDPQRGQRRGNE